MSEEAVQKPKRTAKPKTVETRQHDTTAKPVGETETKVKKASKKPVVEGGYFSVGRRKTAVARVHLVRGDGTINVNGKNFEEYVSKRHSLIAEILRPLRAINLMGACSIEVKANGGGIASQADAIKLGIARALVMMDNNLKSVLGKAGCLVRDPRMKERKKYGQKKARKRFQYSKR